MPNPRLPKSVALGGHTYKVIYPYTFKENNDLCGQVDHQSLEIRVAAVKQNGAPRPPSKIHETFLHELLHAVDCIYNNSQLDEATISRLSEGLWQGLSTYSRGQRRG